MAVDDIDQASAFLRAVASRNADLTIGCVHPNSYVEHDPRVADGATGLRDHVGRLPADSRLEIVRAFADGAFVVTQAKGSVGGRDVFFDVFRLEDGLIVEHWNFSAKGAPPNASGHTQTDGPTEPRHEEDTEANKAIVREYYETVHVRGRHDRIRRFMSGDRQIRHEPGVKDGVAAFEQDLAMLTRDRTIDEIRLLLGRGDLVFVAAKGTHGGGPCVYVDLYRVEDGKLVEHWGFPQEVPPPEDRRNGNGVL